MSTDAIATIEEAREIVESSTAALTELEQLVAEQEATLAGLEANAPGRLAQVILEGSDPKSLKKVWAEAAPFRDTLAMHQTAVVGLRRALAAATAVVARHDDRAAKMAELEATKDRLSLLARRRDDLEAQLDMAVSNTERRRLVEDYRDTRAIAKTTFLGRKYAIGLGCVEEFDVWCASKGLEVVAKNPVHGVFNRRYVNQ